MPTLTPSVGSLTSASSSGMSGASGPERKPSLSQRIRPGRWSLAQDFSAHLFRSSSSASTSTSISRPTAESVIHDNSSSVVQAEDEEGDKTIKVENVLELQMSATATQTTRKAKIYDFLARSASRSRSKSTRRSSDSATPDDPDTTLTTMDSMRSKPSTRSPSRPLSDQTARTHSTITPLPSAPTRAHTPRTNADGYDMSMPPPPVPTSASAKRKSKPPTLFGISLPGRSRPTTPKDERADPLSPPGTPARGRSGFSTSSRKDKASVMPGPSSIPLHAPQPRPAAVKRASIDVHPRSRSSPPPHDVHERPPSSIESARGRCSPFFSMRIFNRSSSRGGSHSRSTSVSRTNSSNNIKGKAPAPPRVSVPKLNMRQTSRDTGPPSAGLVQNGPSSARIGSFDFETRHTHSGFEMKRSVSQGGTERGDRRTRVRGSHDGHPAAAYSQSTSARAHMRASHAHTPRPEPFDPARSAHSQQSTATSGTGAARATADATGEKGGSWGRRAGRQGWVGAGVHPPFAFESAASGSGASNGRASPVPVSEGRPRIDLSPRFRVHELSAWPEREKEREVELGIGLTWAPTKIRVREFTGRRDPPEVPRDRERGTERERTQHATNGHRREMGYRDADLNVRRKADKEVTGRFRVVLGEQGFEKFKKYVRRFDQEIIPLDGASGLLDRVRQLLDTAPPPGVTSREKREMLDDLVRIVKEDVL
ncbi:unnamed protein product [Peniophora sp. CBMAI 1063]|nr:unnamed protein product [Peniophora sp. CBMAI 1063]